MQYFRLADFHFLRKVWGGIRETEQTQHSGTIFWRVLSRLKVRTINIISCSSSLITFEWKSECLNEQLFRLSCLALLKLPMNASLALLSSSHSSSFLYRSLLFFNSSHILSRSNWYKENKPRLVDWNEVSQLVLNQLMRSERLIMNINEQVVMGA